jgi:hypothetical protein
MINNKMEKIDNSNLCWECTGHGCKVCNGTGIDPEYKPKPTMETQTIKELEKKNLDLIAIEHKGQVTMDKFIFVSIAIVLVTTLTTFYL